MSDPGQPDFAALRQRAQNLSADLQDIQHDLTRTQATGHDAGGLVTASVGADGRLLDLRIDPSVIDPDDPEALAALVITAVQNAHQAAIELGSEHLGAVTSQLNGLLAGIRQASRSNQPPAIPAFPVPPVLGKPREAASRPTTPRESDPAADSAPDAPAQPRGFVPNRPSVAAFAPVRPPRPLQSVRPVQPIHPVREP